MLDFLMVCSRPLKGGVTEIYPRFMMVPTKDLMIRGGDFYAIWVEERGLWSTDELDACMLIDKEIDSYAEHFKQETDGIIYIRHMWDADSGVIDSWHKYCQKQRRDSFHMLDEQLIFSDTVTQKADYASKKLPYPLIPCETPAWDRFMSVLYSPDERNKIEWAIGSVITGQSRSIQKFLVLYGAQGTGKSTVINVIEKLFEGYFTVFDAKALGSSQGTFALESFKTNPLVAIQHDGDLSKIEDNTRLNSLVSHELMTVNEKYHSAYGNRFKCFLFMATNRPVKITDAKSGLIRRLIDVTPTGEKIPKSEYDILKEKIPFELGGIACHCRDVFLENPKRYDEYIPVAMMSATNDVYNFVMDSFTVFAKDGTTTRKIAWEMYKQYVDDAKIPYPYTMKQFGEELKNYFAEYEERHLMEDGTRVRNWYAGFREDRFESKDISPPEVSEKKPVLELNKTSSLFDILYADCPAQYAKEDGTPALPWDKVKTKLRDLDPTKLHYVLLPENHIVIDFDICGEDGEKSRDRNLEEAAKFPPTYAEFSKSGCGVHLHYIYTGDPSKLSRIFAPNIEIKVFTGKSSLRRKLTFCNDISVNEISSGLPLKGEKMVNKDVVISERYIETMILRNVAKEIHPDTRSSIDFIFKILEDAYNSGVEYDVEHLRQKVLIFAMGSTHQSDYCVKLVSKMHFSSKPKDIPEAPVEDKPDDERIVFFDCEVFPNLFLVNWKYQGEKEPMHRLINPSSVEIEALCRKKLIGFNNREYDNHMLYERILGGSEADIYNLSRRIIERKDPTAKLRNAYDLSYTDILDFCSKKQSLKKWEIELGIHHQELGFRWDEPVPEEKWREVSEYCDNDVLATEVVFNARQSDFKARLILASIASGKPNDTTNTLSTRIIFGSNREPQNEFNYRNMGDISQAVGEYEDEFIRFDSLGRPIFPGYKFENGVSTYREEEVGEGGYVYAEPGIYHDVALLDIASMHPSSIEAEQLFGERYTKRFAELKQARIYIKHGEFDKAGELFDGVLKPYLTNPEEAEALSGALKIVINSVYGLTAAKFTNPFRDKRNVDNIVAKRGALFMVNLKHEVQKRGYTVAHIKTDSIKIPNADMDIIRFVTEFGKRYGYNFEHEGTYDRICLVNDAVYIAKFATVDRCVELYGEGYVNAEKDILKDNKKHPGEWTATGTQFAVPYVFKTLFTKEPIVFDDLCETKSVTSAIYLDFNEGLPDISDQEKKGDQLIKKGGDSEEIEKIKALSKENHRMSFVGRVGLFCPVEEGSNGGVLYRECSTEKIFPYAAVTGTSGYRWMEAENVKILQKEDKIDHRYYLKLCDEAIDTIEKYGSFQEFSEN